MNPNDYFPDLYLEGIKRFLKREVVDNGPQGVLCGMTFGQILEPQYRCQYKHLKEFIVSLYCLNLINQGIHAYFNVDFSAWCENSVPFPDCQTCSAIHGGISHPNTILKFVKRPSYIPGAKSVHIDISMIKTYIQLFFLDYLAKIEEQLSIMTSNELVSKLMNDDDCVEFQKYWTS